MLPLQRSAHHRLRFQEEDRGFETPCWIWCLSARGPYGQLTVKFKKLLAHRWFYEQLVGPIPDGHDIHHRCEQKLCVNPDHLETMLEAEHAKLHNAQRELKLSCHRGHLFDDDNTRVRIRRGRRIRECRACDREKKTALRLSRKGS